MLELSAKLRSETGRRNNYFRKQGLVPAILYGHKVKNLPLLIEAPELERIYREAGESTLIKLKIKDQQSKKEINRVVLIHEVAKDPVEDKIIHIDFYQVKMDEATRVEVPLVFVGESPAVEREGGVLVKNIQEIEVEALPQDLPHQIEVDISALKTFDDNIYIKDLKIPEKVKTTAQPDEVVASVVPPRTKAELEELEEAPAEAVEEVEVVEKGKKVEAAEAEPSGPAETEADQPKQEAKPKEENE